MEADQAELDLSGLNKNVKRFIKLLRNNPTMTITDAYLQTHGTDNRDTARKAGSRLATKYDSLIHFAEAEEEAQQTIVDIMRNGMKQKRSVGMQKLALEASKDILDRTHGKAVQRVHQRDEKIIVGISVGSSQ